MILGWGRSPGEGNGNPLQYSFLENPMDRGAWQATVHSIAKSQTQPSTIDFTDSSVSRSVMSSVQGDSPGKNTGVGRYAFLQGIFPTQRLNSGLLHYRRILYLLSHYQNGLKNRWKT